MSEFDGQIRTRHWRYVFWSQAFSELMFSNYNLVINPEIQIYLNSDEYQKGDKK
jgi:hypothetical protein